VFSLRQIKGAHVMPSPATSLNPSLVVVDLARGAVPHAAIFVQSCSATTSPPEGGPSDGVRFDTTTRRPVIMFLPIARIQAKPAPPAADPVAVAAQVSPPPTRTANRPRQPPPSPFIRDVIADHDGRMPLLLCMACTALVLLASGWPD
jgi:hypothetical protein